MTAFLLAAGSTALSRSMLKCDYISMSHAVDKIFHYLIIMASRNKKEACGGEGGGVYVNSHEKL